MAYKKPSFQKLTKEKTKLKQHVQKLSKRDHQNPVASPSMTNKNTKQSKILLMPIRKTFTSNKTSPPYLPTAVVN